MSSLFTPEFKLSGPPAARWLGRLRYDFKRGGVSEPTPESLIHSIYLLVEGKAAIFLDSTFSAICESKASSSADLEKLESAFKFEFPSILVDVIDVPVQHQIRELSQAESEPLQAYTQRTARLLYKSGGRDKVKDGAELSPIEEFALGQVVQAYLEGLYDPELRMGVLAKMGECKSLSRASEVVMETTRSREAIARLNGNNHRDLEQLRAVMNLPPPPITPLLIVEANMGRTHDVYGYNRRQGKQVVFAGYQDARYQPGSYDGSCTLGYKAPKTPNYQSPSAETDSA